MQWQCHSRDGGMEGGGHGTVLDDRGPSAVATVTGAAPWCCSCSIYSNRLTHGPLRVTRGQRLPAHYLISATVLQPCVLASWPQWFRCSYPFPTNPPPLSHSVSYSGLVCGCDWSSKMMYVIDLFAVWNPRRYRMSRSYDSGPSDVPVVIVMSL